MTQEMPQPQTFNFTPAFQQMASLVAISKTKNRAEIIDQLVQQCFVIHPEKPLTTTKDIQTSLQNSFGLHLIEQDIAFALDRLKRMGSIIDIAGGQLGLSQKVQQELQARILEAKLLEDDVKATWLSQLSATKLSLDSDELWQALKQYLAQAFRRHGIITINLLDPSAEIGKEYSRSLSSILNSIVTAHFSEAQRNTSRDAISSFLASIRSDRKRAEYVTQLADGAFNYFSLAVAPEISQKLREKLVTLTLFLDTNFLFGILDLHMNSQVDVSIELVEAIREFKFPFRLRYHEATTHEMSNTILYYGTELSKRKWAQSISRIAIRSNALSGIELSYHQKNVKSPVEVEDFLAPFRHWEILLKDKTIDVYRVSPSEQILRKRADLEAAYTEFLERVSKEKPREAIQHDMAVLQTVKSLRTSTKSTLESGAILVTCDFQLYRFDLELSRTQGQPSSTVLPSTLWQILRPFVSTNTEFDYAFAETFALPEFCLARGGATKAASRMLSVLSSYQTVPEETAVKMLANDLLLSEMQPDKTDAEVREIIDSEFARQTNILSEEKAALAGDLEKEKETRMARELELKAKDEQLKTKELELKVKEDAIGKKQMLLQQIEVAKNALVDKVAKEHDSREKLVAQLDIERNLNVEKDAQIEKYWRLIHIFISLVLIAAFELVLRVFLKWNWLLSHPRAIALQMSFCLLIILLYLGFVVKKWRKWCLGVGVSIILAILKLL